MVVAELKKLLESAPDDREVVITSPDILPFSRRIASAGSTRTEDGGQTCLVLVGGMLGTMLPTGGTDRGGH